MNFKKYLAENPQHNRFTFGNFIRQRRDELGLSVRQMSYQLKITPAYLSDIEKGNRHAPVKMLDQMMDILKIDETDKLDFIDLAYLTKETCAPDLIEYLIASKEARQAIRYLKENNINGTKMLEIVTKKDENFKKL